MDDTSLTFTPEAIKTLGEMQDRVTMIGRTYGETSDDYGEVLESYAQAITGVIRLGGRITRDGELSLYGVSFIHYGVIWHAKRLPDGSRDELLGEWSTHS